MENKKLITKMEVELIKYTKDLELIKEKVLSIYRTTEGMSDKALLKAIKAGHLSLLEYIDFTFKIKCSIVTSRQGLRHRIATYGERTMRINKGLEFQYILPPTIENNNILELIINHYNKSNELYNTLIDLGVSSEEARYVIPLGVATEYIYKTNLRSLITFIQQRYCIHAQTEIRNVAKQIYDYIADLSEYSQILHLFDNKCIGLEKQCKKCIREHHEF